MPTPTELRATREAFWRFAAAPTSNEPDGGLVAHARRLRRAVGPRARRIAASSRPC